VSFLRDSEGKQKAHFTVVQVTSGVTWGVFVQDDPAGEAVVRKRGVDRKMETRRRANMI
jgi:hypothetical protein